MTGGILLLFTLLVSWTSLILQSIAMISQMLKHSSSEAERIVERGYVRTAACRVVAATVYATASLLQTLGVPIPYAGVLTPEALIIFTAVQLLWWYNAGMDVLVRHKLANNLDQQNKSVRDRS